MSETTNRPLAKCETVAQALTTVEFRQRIAQSVPQHVKPERLLRVFSLAVTHQPELMKVDMRTFVGACLSFSQLGLEPNTPLGQAYLIPFKRKIYNPETRRRDTEITEVQPIIGYPGLIDLAYRSPIVSAISCNVIYESDDYDFSYGTDLFLRHRPMGRQRDGEDPEFAYMVAKLRDGVAMEVLPWREVMRIRSGSQGYQRALQAKDDAEAKGWSIPRTYTEAPWIKHKIAMARKTAIRAGVKYLPKSPELARAAELDEMGDNRQRIQFGAWTEAITYKDENGKQREDYVGSVIDASGSWEDDDPRDEQIHQERGLATRTQVQGADLGAGQQQQRQQEQQQAARTQPRTAETQPPAGQTQPATGRTSTRTKTADAKPAARNKAGDPATQRQPEPQRQQQQEQQEQQQAADEFPMLDQFGEHLPASGIQDNHDDPEAWADAFAKVLLGLKPDQRSAFIEHNTDVAEAVRRASAKASKVLEDAIAVATEPASEVETPEFQALMPPMDRGGPSWSRYRDAFEQMIADIPEGELLQWLDAQRTTIETIPDAIVQMGVIRRTAQALADFGIASPEWLAEVGNKLVGDDVSPPAEAGTPATSATQGAQWPQDQEAQPEDANPAAGEPPPDMWPDDQQSSAAPEDPPPRDPDAERAEEILNTLAQIKTRDEVRVYSQNTIVRRLMVGGPGAKGWKETRPDLFRLVAAEFDRRSKV